MPFEASGPRFRLAMYARAVDEARVHLQDLRRVEWEDLGLGGLALGLAVAVTQVRESLALPLFLGGLTLWLLGLRAFWRRWDLVDRLADDRDAYGIPEVFAYASRKASMDRRRYFATMIRNRLDDPGLSQSSAAAELEKLAGELEDPALDLDPACAVACFRMLSDPAGSPLLNSVLDPAELRSRASRICSGFTERGKRAFGEGRGTVARHS